MHSLRAAVIRLNPIVRSVRSSYLGKVPITGNANSVPSTCYATKAEWCGINDFFDEDNFDTSDVGVGRPWRKEELRIKSNQDLHKLWYVLLKERNVVLTMEHMYTEVMEPLPNPERIDKVEESMENLLEVTKERKVAYELLEHGHVDEAKKYVARNAVGIPYERTPKEHYLPKHLNKRFQKMHPKQVPWMAKYLALYEEKYRQQRNYKFRMHEKKRKDTIEEFDLEEDDIPKRLDHTGDRLEEFLEQTTDLDDVNRHGR